MKTFKYKIRRDRQDPIRHPQPRVIKDSENLSGMVQGWSASDIEERFARALEKMKKDYPLSYEFRTTIFGARNEVGFKELDYRIYTMTGNYAVELDGSFAHKSIATKEEDAAKDQMVNSLLKKDGYYPLKRIPGDQLGTQEQADKLVKDLII